MAGQGLPTVSQWRRFLQHRQQAALQLLTSVVCIRCLKPLQFSDMQYSRHRERSSMSRGGTRFNAATIVVSALIRRFEEVETPLLGGDVATDVVAKVVPMFLSGPGCPDCQYAMVKAVGEADSIYQADCARFEQLKKDPDLARLLARLGRTPQPRRASLDMTREVLEYAKDARPERG